MTVNTTPVEINYTGNASTTVFALPFAFAANAHVKVYLGGVLQGSGYSITGAGNPSGGTLTMTTAPGTGVALRARRVTPLTQEIDVVNNATVFASSLETGLDYALMRQQEDVFDQSVMRAELDDFAADVTATAANAAAALAAKTAAETAETNAETAETNAEAAQAAAEAARDLAEADRVQTGLDRVATAADVVAAEADRVATAADRVVTTADRVQTGLDRTQTGLDRVQTGLDVTAAATSATQAAGSAALTINATGVLNFDTVAQMEADTTLGYASGIIVAAGNIIRAGGLTYTVAASGASDNDDVTAGGVKLYYSFSGVYRSGPLGEPNTALNDPTLNFIAPHATASHAMGGTTGLPNQIGKEFYWEKIAGDGVTAAFIVDAGFTVPDKSWAVRVKSFDNTTNMFFPVTVNTITGYGTDTVTITLSAALAADRHLFVEIIGANDDPATSARLVFTEGYNNVGNELMSIMHGSHIRFVGSDGHNGALYGSNHLSLGGAYNCMGGTNTIVGLNDPASSGCIALGQNIRADGRAATAMGFNVAVNGNNSTGIGEDLQIVGGSNAVIGIDHAVTGTANAVFGNGHTVIGNYNIVAGLDHTITSNYLTIFGRLHTVAAGDYSFICGYENSNGSLGYTSAFGNKAVVRNTTGSATGYSGAVAGSRQSAKAYAAVQTTTTGLVTLTKTGGSAIKVGASAAARIKGTLIGRDKNSEAAVYFDIDALIRTTSGGTTTIVSGDPPTLTASDASLSTCTADLLPGTSGVSIRAAGVAATTINWLAVVDIVEVSADAA